MKRILMDRLDDIRMLSYQANFDICMGFSVVETKDIYGTPFKVKHAEKKYIFITHVANNSMFISEDYLLRVLLGEYTDQIDSGDIYEDGYPEGRLIPRGHIEGCNEGFLEEVIDEINEKVNNILDEHFLTASDSIE